MMSDELAFVGKLIALDAHAIDTDVCDGRLFAAEITCIDGVASSNWVDVTDWSRAELFAWLGY